MRVNFVGTSCTGKTSLLEAIEKDKTFSGFEKIGSLSRKLVREGKIQKGFSSIENQKVIFDEYVSLIDKDNYISDRCIIDVYTFTKTFSQTPAVLYEQDREAMLCNLYDMWLDQIFYFPTYWKVEDDGERLAEEERRSLWDINIRHYFQANDISFIIMPNVSVEERVKFVKRTLGL